MCIRDRYITKCSTIQLKKLMKSSAGLRRKIKMIGRLRWVNLAAQAVFNTVSKKLQEIATVDSHSDTDLTEIIDKYSKKDNKMDENKPGSLLDLTYRKRKAAEWSEGEMSIEDLIGRRKVICMF
eukprot:TRINITY_DN5373_c0_g1_i4.p1 TRINITY_DN5373_c0_g1~~TRINITY_DN5373_c0_g1_i4.p1  ORF type:complete len:139 (-),score=26.72 TRINITY_DN5373_c0_g1_i4:114-485(-)